MSLPGLQRIFIHAQDVHPLSINVLPMSGNCSATDNSSTPLYFFLYSLSPHITPLLCATASIGFTVTVFYQVIQTDRRKSMGWSIPHVTGIRLVKTPSIASLKQNIRNIPNSSISVIQGIRGNGVMHSVPGFLQSQNLKCLIYMESINFKSFPFVLKEIFYRTFFLRHRHILAVLSIGSNSGVFSSLPLCSPIPSFPFGYFLESQTSSPAPTSIGNDTIIKIIYIGSFIRRKRVDLLISALADLSRLALPQKFTLTLVGDGPLRESTLSSVPASLSSSIEYLGTQNMEQVQAALSSHDILVLPSDFDGWGAVVVEALLHGLTVVCSSACGVSETLKDQPFVQIFKAGSCDSLVSCLYQLLSGPNKSILPKPLVSAWAQRALSAHAGAMYLSQIIWHICNRSSSNQPRPPWLESISELSN